MIITTILQSAIDKAVANGEVLRIPPGVYTTAHGSTPTSIAAHLQNFTGHFQTEQVA